MMVRGRTARRSTVGVQLQLTSLEDRTTPATYFTTTTLTSSLNPAVQSQAVTLSATVNVPPFNVAPPGGAVIFYNDAAELGRVDVAQSGPDLGTAKLTVTTLPVGTLNLRAAYSGTIYSSPFSFSFDIFQPSEDTLTQTITAPVIQQNPTITTDSPTTTTTSDLITPTVTTTTTSTPVFQPRMGTGAEAGAPPIARLLRTDGSIDREVMAFDPGFLGGVRVAVGDVTGDGIPDLIAVPGPGAAPLVRVFDGSTGGVIWEKFAFETTFRGGLFVTAGDVTGDGIPEVVVTPDQGGGPVIKMFDGRNGGERSTFFGIDDPAFRGGARASLGDVNGDGRYDLLVSAGFGGGPRIAVYNGTQLLNVTGRIPPRLMDDFFVFEETLRNGAFVASGDFNADGYADLLFGAGPGGGPRILALDAYQMMRRQGKNNSTLFDFFADSTSFRGGVSVGCGDVDNDGVPDVLASTFGGRLNIFSGTNRTPITVADRIQQAGGKGGMSLNINPAKATLGKNGPLDYMPPDVQPNDSNSKPLDPIEQDNYSSGNQIPVGTFTSSSPFEGQARVTFTNRDARQKTDSMTLYVRIQNQTLTTGGGSIILTGRIGYTLDNYYQYNSADRSFFNNYRIDECGFTAEVALPIEGRPTPEGGKIRDATAGGTLKEDADSNRKGYRASAKVSSIDARTKEVILENIVINFAGGEQRTVAFTIPYLSLMGS